MSDQRDKVARDTILIVASAIAAFFLFHNLGAYPLWDDEANTAIVAQGVWTTGDTLAQVGDNLSAWGDGLNLTGKYDRSQPPLQFYCAAPSVGLLGTSALAARLPFALIGLATVVGLFRWARRSEHLFHYVAWCLAMLGSVSLLLYCRQARYYAPALACTAAACWAYWSATHGRRSGWWLGLALAGLLAANYLSFAALVIVLAMDCLVWQWRQRPLPWRELGRAAIPVLLVGIPVLWIWYPLGRYASDALNPDSAHPLLSRLRYGWWFLRDASVSQLVPGLLLVVCPLLYWYRRDTWYLRVPAAVVVYLLAMGLLAPQGDWQVAGVRYAMPVVLGGIAITAMTAIAAFAYSRPVGVLLLVLAATTNTFHLDWADHQPIGPVPRFMPVLFAGELLHPQDEPYTPTIQWLKEHVPAGSYVMVGPAHMRYPLMYHAPHAVYGWQIRPETAQRRFPGLDPRQIRGQAIPDYLVGFGPGMALMRRELSLRLAPGIAYQRVATIDHFFRDEYRPEMLLRRFGAPRPYLPDEMIVVMKRVPLLDGSGPATLGIWRTGDR